MYALLNLNDANDAGDTPLHLAAKWGYGKKLEDLHFMFSVASIKPVDWRNLLADKILRASCSKITVDMPNVTW